jgi:linoleate 10R-lipoxygenase
VGVEANFHQTAAAALYKNINNLELHVSFSSVPSSQLLNPVKVGLQAEEAKDPVPGAGLCPGYTISRAILADAVSLTRGDPYFTTEFTRWCSPQSVRRMFMLCFF